MITKREEGMRYADKQEGMEGEEQITRREIKEGKEDEQKTRKKRKEEGKKSKQPEDNQGARYTQSDPQPQPHCAHNTAGHSLALKLTPLTVTSLTPRLTLIAVNQLI